LAQILLAIKLVKFYVWEKSFAGQVEQVRLPARCVKGETLPSTQARHQG
jgi:hypothetical protein